MFKIRMIFVLGLLTVTTATTSKDAFCYGCLTKIGNSCWTDFDCKDLGCNVNPSCVRLSYTEKRCILR